MNWENLPCDIKRAIFDVNRKRDIFDAIKNYNKNLHKKKFNKRKLVGIGERCFMMNTNDLLKFPLWDLLDNSWRNMPPGIIGVPFGYYIDDNIEEVLTVKDGKILGQCS